MRCCLACCNIPNGFKITIGNGNSGFNTQDDTSSIALKQKGLRPFCLNYPPSMAGFQPKRKFNKQPPLSLMKKGASLIYILHISRFIFWNIIITIFKLSLTWVGSRQCQFCQIGLPSIMRFHKSHKIFFRTDMR